MQRERTLVKSGTLTQPGTLTQGERLIEVWRRLQLGAPTDIVDIESASAWDQLPVGTKVELGDPLFPRLDVEAIDFEVE